MPTWKGIVGAAFSPDTFDKYCHSLQWLAWRPSFMVLHNTAIPTLANRPTGLSHQHILNLQQYYRDTCGWSAGPHLFIDDRQIWVFTPLTVSGVHYPCFNKVALGIEMLGDYSQESFTSGRGLQVRHHAVAALGLDPTTLKLHKENKCTDHVHPGKNVVKKEVIAEVQALLQQRHGGDHLFPADLTYLGAKYE
ncbi:hypothetical protein [Hymenobacter bucti]|uniref:N-acetylmuramoyl-L-alanine amidase domain-containing protein n=1 Tax=Hymenobacter bucti TaxID=1844114 RepID=A0ABW4QYN0_9BACT